MKVGGLATNGGNPDKTESNTLLSDEKHVTYAAITTESLNSSDATKKKKNFSRNQRLLVSFVLMVFFALVNRIFSRLATYPMYNYPYSNTLIGIAVYLPVCFAYILPMIKYGSYITQEQLDIPWYKFGIMGLLDSISGIMQIYAFTFITNAAMIVLLQQSAIPISMIISKIFLNVDYTSSQYSGAIIVCFGIFIVIAPTSWLFSSSSSSNDSTPPTSSSDMFWWIIMVTSCIPQTLSSVYKEKALGETDIDVVYLNGQVAFYQLVLSLPLAFPSASISHLPMSDILSNTINGFWCCFGFNSITSEDIADNKYPWLTQPDDCHTAPVFVGGYLFINIIYNLLQIFVIKYGGSNVLWLSSTLVVPVSNYVFSLSFMPHAVPERKSDLFGLIAIMSGLFVYRYFEPLYDRTRKYAYKYQLIKSDEGSLEDFDDDEDAEDEEDLQEGMVSGVFTINQAENLRPLIQVYAHSRVATRMTRSSSRIRRDLFYNLGVSPSPHHRILPRRPVMPPSPTLTGMRSPSKAPKGNAITLSNRYKYSPNT